MLSLRSATNAGPLFPQDLSETSNLTLAEIEKEIKELKVKNMSLKERIQATELRLEQEKKSSAELRAKTHSLEIRSFSLRDELEQEKTFSQSSRTQAENSQLITMKEILKLKDQLGPGWNENPSGFGKDGPKLPDVNTIEYRKMVSLK